VPAAFLLDLYGTLVEPDWQALIEGRAAIAQRVGVAAAAARGAWDTTHSARMVGAYGSLADDLAAVFSRAPERRLAAIPPALLSELAEEELENWSRGVRLFPDAMPALSLIRSSGFRLAIVTNASAEAASVVEVLGLRSAVDAVFASCASRVLKPDLLAVALRGLGVQPADATLVDDEPAQLDGAARLGINTIRIRRPGTEESAAGRPHREITDLRQLTPSAVREEPARPR